MGRTTEAPETSSSWAFFDRVYCISLDERPDRRQEAERQFRRVGLAERVEFLVVRKDPVDAERGIHSSHMECFRRGIRAGARTVLVFEDDIVFDRFEPAVLAACCRFLAAADWNMFFLGCLCAGSRRTESPAVLQVRYRGLTHAYAVRSSFAENLLAHPWRGQPYDMLLKERCEGFYAAYPSFAFQSNAATDNLRLRQLDRLRRLCGGLARIQKMNEFYHRHRWAVVAAHVLLLAGLLALAARS
jgi:GR25 family glycosyltransferase involved in LPS biosynthesis